MDINLKLNDLKKIFDKSRIGVYIYTKEEGVIYVNKSVLSILDLKREDFTGFNFLRYLEDEKKAEIIKYANLVFAGYEKDIPYPIEVKFNNQKKEKEIRFYPEVMVLDNNKKCIVGFTVDITGENEIKQNDESLNSNREVLNLLENFNNMLTGILGYTSLLKLKERREEDREIVKHIYDTTIEASKLISSFIPYRNELPEKSNNFLIADEDSISATVLKKILKEQGYSVTILNGKNINEEIIKYLSNIRGAFIDIYIPGINTFGFISDILNKKNNSDVVLMAHERELKEVQDILDIHDVYFLQKPIIKEKVLELLKLMERSET